MLEVYRCATSEYSSILWEFFNRKVGNEDKRQGNEPLSFRRSTILNQLPGQYKDATHCTKFKKKIRSEEGFGCNCHICIQFNIASVHFS